MEYRQRLLPQPCGEQYERQSLPNTVCFVPDASLISILHHELGLGFEQVHCNKITTAKLEFELREIKQCENNHRGWFSIFTRIERKSRRAFEEVIERSKVRLLFGLRTQLGH